MNRPSVPGLLPTVALVALVSSAFVTCARQEAQVAPTPPAKPQVPGFTLVFTTGAVGYLEPCGCSPDQRGGVARAAALVDALRAEGRNVLLVDGGDRFFPAEGLPKDPLSAQQTRLQAATMADVTKAMGYDAVVLGARDLPFRPEIPLESLPPVLDTGDTAAPGTRALLVKEVGGKKLGLVAVGTGETAARTLAARVQAAREQGATLVILLAYANVADAKALLPAAKQAGVAFVLATRADVPETHESAALTESDPPLFTVQARGEAVLRLDAVAEGPAGSAFVRVSGAAERDAELAAMQQRIDLMREDVKLLPPGDAMKKLKTEKMLELEGRRAAAANAAPPAFTPGTNAFMAAFIPMTPSIGESKPVRALVDRYDALVSEKNLAFAQANPKECPAAEKGKPVFVGDERCLDCHEEAFEFWKKTGHSHAFQTLVDKKKQFNVQCIGCHVTGWEQPGGACSIAKVEGRKNVQCESCHGPGSIHAEDGEDGTIALEVPAATCQTCHDAPNSPHFKYDVYRKKILGPGHGEPLPKAAPDAGP